MEVQADKNGGNLSHAYFPYFVLGFYFYYYPVRILYFPSHFKPYYLIETIFFILVSMRNGNALHCMDIIAIQVASYIYLCQNRSRCRPVIPVSDTTYQPTAAT
jgi:hypothetical protein